MLKRQCPDAEVVTANPDALLPFARMVNVQTMPFVVCIGEPDELESVLK
jgi:hypothetical protein